MNCDRAKELFTDRLAGNLGDEARAELNAHLEKCAACREEQQGLEALWTRLSLLPELEPSPAADRSFATMLRGYREGLDQKEQAPGPGLFGWLTGWWPAQPAWQFAAVLLLFGGGVVAGWKLGPGRAGSPGSEVAELRQEVQNLKEQMALALLEENSAGERLMGVEWTSRLRQPDEQVLSALVRTLESDPNVNVRLAALDALQPFVRQPLVKKALLDSLPRQDSPLVQIELIHLLVEKEEKDSMPVLKALAENRDLDQSVRQRAWWGLSKLGV